MAYSTHETRAKSVPVTVSSGAQRKVVVVDQTVMIPEGKHFRPIDTVDLEADTETTIKIDLRFFGVWPQANATRPNTWTWSPHASKKVVRLW